MAFTPTRTHTYPIDTPYVKHLYVKNPESTKLSYFKLNIQKLQNKQNQQKTKKYARTKAIS